MVEMNLSSGFFLIKFEKFLVLYLGCGGMTFEFTAKMTSSHLLSMLIIKNLSTKTTKDIPKC